MLYHVYNGKERMCASTHMQRLEDIFVDLFSSSKFMQTQGLGFKSPGLCGKCLYLLCCLSGPTETCFTIQSPQLIAYLHCLSHKEDLIL